MENAEATVMALHGLHDIGVSLAIDDFGTGHWSLAYLKRFLMDKLKIDRSFMNDVVDDADDAAIAQIIINLAKQLNLGVIAEGVETVSQLEFLRERTVATKCRVIIFDWYGIPPLPGLSL